MGKLAQDAPLVYAGMAGTITVAHSSCSYGMMTRWLLMSEAKTVANIGQAMQKLQQMAARIQDPARRQWFLQAGRTALISGEKRLDVPEEFVRGGEAPHGQFPFGDPGRTTPGDEYYQGETPEAAALEFLQGKFEGKPRLDKWVAFRKGKPVQEIRQWLKERGYDYDADALFNYLNDLFTDRPKNLPAVRPRKPEEYFQPAGWLKKPPSPGYHSTQSQQPATASAIATSASLVRRGGEPAAGAIAAEPPETTHAIAKKSPSAFKFDPDDVGAYLIWDSGAEAKIASVENPTEVGITDLNVPASRALLTRASKQRYPVDVELSKGTSLSIVGTGYQFSQEDVNAEITWEGGINGTIGTVESPTVARLSNIVVPAGPFVLYAKGRKKLKPRLYGPSYEEAIRRLMQNILMEVDYRSILRHRSKDPEFKSSLARGIEQTYQPYQKPKQFGDPTAPFEPSAGEELVTVQTRKAEAQPLWQGFENLADFLNSIEHLPSTGSAKQFRERAEQLMAQSSSGSPDEVAIAFEELTRQANEWAKTRRATPGKLSKNIMPYTDLGKAGDLWMIGSSDKKFLRWIAAGGVSWCVQYSHHFDSYLKEVPDEYPYFILILKKVEGTPTPFRAGVKLNDTDMVAPQAFDVVDKEGQQSIEKAEGGYHPYVLAHLLAHEQKTGSPQVKNVTNTAIGPKMGAEIAPLFVRHPDMWQYMKGAEWTVVTQEIQKLVGARKWEQHAIRA